MLSPKLRNQPQIENDITAVEKLLDAALPPQPKVYSWVPVARFCTVAVVLTGCATALALVGQHLYNNRAQPPLPPGTYERATLTVNEDGRIIAVAQGEALPALPPGTYLNAAVTVDERGRITGIAAGPSLTPGVHPYATVTVDERGQITGVTPNTIPVQTSTLIQGRTTQATTTAALTPDLDTPRSTNPQVEFGPRVDYKPQRPDPAPGTTRVELAPDASADEAAVWCRKTYPATIQEWCFDTWVKPRKIAPVISVDARPFTGTRTRNGDFDLEADRQEPEPTSLQQRRRQPSTVTSEEVQKEIDRTSKGGKIITNYTIFRNVNWKKGTVETGWRFPHNSAAIPEAQWCHYRWVNPATGNGVMVDLGSQASAAAISSAGLTTADYQEGQTHCVWFNNTKPRTS